MRVLALVVLAVEAHGADEAVVVESVMVLDVAVVMPLLVAELLTQLQLPLGLEAHSILYGHF